MLRYLPLNCLRRLPVRWYSKDVKFGDEVRGLMIEGVDILTRAVAVTMGPKGRSVILDQDKTSPKITKDGVTVARAITLKDKYKNLGAKLVQDVANHTNELAGDGTTTATVLARAIAKEGFEHITKGANPVEIRRGVMLAVEAVKAHLKIMSKPVVTDAEITQVATISANGDANIGKLICNAIKLVGRNGVINIRESKTLTDELEVIEGIKFDNGYLSPFFVNSSKGSKVVFNNALIVITLKKITSIKQLVNALEIAYKKRKPLVIIADDITGEALSILVVNKLKLGLQICAIKAPSFGDHRKAILSDLATATGATIFGDDTNYANLEKIRFEEFGVVGEAIITKESTMLLKGQGKKENIARHVELLKEELKECDTDVDRARIQERLSRLTSGVAILRIGGSSEVEINEKKDRANDAVNAVRAAILEGIVPGGGTAYLRCIPKLDEIKYANTDQKIGIDIIRNALRMPCMTLAENAGLDGAMIVAEVMNGQDDYGYDALKNEYGYLIKKGIIDPTRVVCSAISDAAGVASLLSTTEVVITDMRNRDLLARLAAMSDLGAAMGAGAGSGLGSMSMDGMGNLGGLGGNRDTIDEVVDLAAEM